MTPDVEHGYHHLKEYDMPNSKSKKDEIELCPFCGCKPSCFNWKGMIFVQCDTNRNCHIYGFQMSLERWNTRNTPKEKVASKDEVEELVDYLREYYAKDKWGYFDKLAKFLLDKGYSCTPKAQKNKCRVCDKEAWINQKENGWRCQDHTLFGTAKQEKELKEYYMSKESLEFMNAPLSTPPVAQEGDK